jgi:membrane fusion protein, multidrug efflux system
MYLRGCGFAAAALLWTACATVEIESSADALEAPLTPVRTALAEVRPIPIEIGGVGNVEAITTIAVRSRVSGAIVKAHVRGGEMVRAGDPLFEIDVRPFEQQITLRQANLARDKALLSEAEAHLARARAEDAYAAQQLDRAELLYREGVLSLDQVQQARAEAAARSSTVRAQAAAIDSARAAVEASDAALAAARLELSYCKIKSPITGRVGSLQIHAGNLVRAESDELVSIRQMSPIEVVFSVPESNLAALLRRQRQGPAAVRATIPGDSDEAPQGALSFLDNAIDAATGTIRLKATFPNQDLRLWPGQFVDARVTLEARAAQVVTPATALQTGQDGLFVYVVAPGGLIELRPVLKGPSSGRAVSILEGVVAGERVVTEGHLRVRPGMKVKDIS